MASEYFKYLSKEDHLTKNVINYIHDNFPNVLAFHIPNEGRRSNFERYKLVCTGVVKGIPDIFVAHSSNGFHGLFIECKAVNIFTSDGNLLKDEKLSRQAAVLYHLAKNGYMASFGIHYEHCKALINTYFTGGITNQILNKVVKIYRNNEPECFSFK